MHCWRSFLYIDMWKMNYYVVSLRASCFYLAVNEAQLGNVLLLSKSAISQSGTWIDRSIIIRLMCVALNARKLAIDIPEAREDPLPFIYFHVYVPCKFVCRD